MLLPLLALALVQQQATPGTGPTPYWQQRVDYTIDAALDESKGVLSGHQSVRYRNNSPDTLRQLSFHLYLNAFRPGSRWAAADSVEHNRRFNDLTDPNFGFNHVRNVVIMGQPVTASYPFAPDSTIVRFLLPRPLAPGDSLVAELDWDARPSIPPRRQGRRGRAFDFAQWYPRVVVYDQFGWEEHPLYPAGEFYGEFGSFLVRLDVAEDQVIGATGVPVCGDPGWEGASRQPGRAVEYQRGFYGDPARFGTCPAPAAGRKRVTWYADQVHHFAMSLNPEYRYEGGRWGAIAVHVLYQPGDEKTWGNGIAVKRTEGALAWLDHTFGTFPWPQLTNVHRIEGGGTEFPMMIMDGSASEGLIVHELGHNYLMGILANNEWREGWLDEGFTEYQTGLYDEAKGQGGDFAARTEQFLLGMQLDGYAEPVSLVSNDYRDFFTYNTTIYSGGELFLRRLQYVLGDSVMAATLRNYYSQWKLKHVNEDRFRAVAEETSGLPLGPFFAQQLHAVDLTDFAVGRTDRSQTPDGWVTRVEVVRKAPRQLPVEVWVYGATDTAVVRASGQPEREWVEVRTRSRPTGVTLDPRVQTGDWNFLNNHKSFGLGSNAGRVEPYLDTYFSTRTARDHLTLGLAPEAWYNDAGGVTVGLRARTDYLGRFEQNVLSITGGTGWGADDPVQDLDVFARIKNPTWLRGTNWSQMFEGYSMEGRSGATVTLEKKRRDHRTFGPTVTKGLTLRWVDVFDTAFVDPGFYDDAGTVEGSLYGAISGRSGAWQLGLGATAGVGVMYGYAGAGTITSSSYDAQGYFRGALTATARRTLGAKWGVAFRGYAGAALADEPVVKQRQVYLAGADPYQSLYNPFLRSEGALLVRPGVYYQAPGGANLRGFDPHASSRQAYALNAQVERTVVTRRNARFFSSVSLSAWGDAALADLPSGSAPYGPLRGFYDAGLGVSASHRIGTTSFVTRFDFPLFVSEAGLAQDADPSDTVGFRWLFSFAPAL